MLCLRYTPPALLVAIESILTLIKPNDVFALLDTNHGDYAAACSVDFSKPPNYYDTFALRDAAGHEAVSSTWPFFRDAATRYAMKHFAPIQVKSCWNGIGKITAI